MKQVKIISLLLFVICVLSSCSAIESNNSVLENSSSVESETEESTENVLSVVDVTSMTKETATTILESKGFVVEIKEENSDTVENGIVISQQPTYGNNLNQGDTITLVVSKGKLENEKTYLNTMGYTEHNSTCSYNNWSPFEGEDGHGNDCEYGYQFYIDSDYDHYTNSEEVKNAGCCSYKVSFDLSKKYKTFNFKLTAGERLDTETAKIKILGDEKHLYGNGVTEKTNQIPVSIDVTDVDTLTFEISVGFTTYNYYDNHYIILNNAYFE